MRLIPGNFFSTTPSTSNAEIDPLIMDVIVFLQAIFDQYQGPGHKEFRGKLHATIEERLTPDKTVPLLQYLSVVDANEIKKNTQLNNPDHAATFLFTSLMLIVKYGNIEQLTKTLDELKKLHKTESTPSNHSESFEQILLILIKYYGQLQEKIPTPKSPNPIPTL